MNLNTVLPTLGTYCIRYMTCTKSTRPCLFFFEGSKTELNIVSSVTELKDGRSKATGQKLHIKAVSEAAREPRGNNAKTQRSHHPVQEQDPASGATLTA